MSRVTLLNGKSTDQALDAQTFQKPNGFHGTSAAHLLKLNRLQPREKMSMKPYINITAIAALLATVFSLTSLPCARADGTTGSGGTNVNKNTMEPVEFDRLGGNLVQINPKNFESLYAQIKPRLEAIEDRIPGLGVDLEKTLTGKNWFITKKKFDPRNGHELKPIYQDETGIFINIDEFKKMLQGKSREKAEKAWFHELVRGFVLGCSDVGPGEVDSNVEQISSVLYLNYGLSSQNLKDRLPLMVRKRYFSKAQIKERYAPYLRVYNEVCEGLLKNVDVDRLSKEEIKPLVSSVFERDPIVVHSHSYVEVLDAWILFAAKFEAEQANYRADLTSFYGSMLKNVAKACQRMNSSELDFLRKVTGPDEALPFDSAGEVNTVEDAIRRLNDMNRGPASNSSAKLTANTKKASRPSASEIREQGGSSDNARSAR